MVVVLTTNGKTATHTSVTVQIFTLTPTFDTRTATGVIPTEALTIPTTTSVAKDVSNGSTSTGTIVGSVVGSVAGAVIICLLIFLFFRLRKKKKQEYLDKDAALQDDEIMRQYGGVGTTATTTVGGGRGDGSGYNNAFNASLPSISDHHAVARATTETGQIQPNEGSRGGGFFSKFIPVGFFNRSGPGKPPGSVGSPTTSSRSTPAAAGAAGAAGVVDNPRSFYRQPRRASLAATGGNSTTTTAITGSVDQSVNSYGSVPVMPADEDVFNDDNRVRYSDEDNPLSYAYNQSQQPLRDQGGSSNSNSMNSQSWSYTAEAAPAGPSPQQFHRPFGRHVVNPDNEGYQGQPERQPLATSSSTPESPLSPLSSDEEQRRQGLQGKSFFTEDL